MLTKRSFTRLLCWPGFLAAPREAVELLINNYSRPSKISKNEGLWTVRTMDVGPFRSKVLTMNLLANVIRRSDQATICWCMFVNQGRCQFLNSI